MIALKGNLVNIGESNEYFDEKKSSTNNTATHEYIKLAVP